MPAVVSRKIPRLAKEDRDAIAAFGARTSWPAGFTLYERDMPADGIFIVLSGQVVLRNRLGSSRSFVPWVATEGETFGGEGLDLNARYVSDARVEEESETMHLSTARLSSLMREQPAHAMALMRQVVAERAEVLSRFGEQATLTVEQRLMSALLRLARARESADENGGGASAMLSRRLLGEVVGATRESISLVLGRLSAEGLVQREGTGLLIPNLARLADRLSRSLNGVPDRGERGARSGEQVAAVR